MSSEPKEVNLLIVEDEDGWADLVSADAASGGYTTARARTLVDALAQVDDRRFDAAMIDMSLTHVSSREGEKVIQVLDGLAEGTAFAVLSAHTGASLASKLALVYRAPLITKQSKNVDNLANTISTMVETGHASRPRPSNFQPVLRGQLSGIDWEILLSRTLAGVPGGVPTVNKLLSGLLAKFGPLVAPTDAPSIARLRDGLLGGNVWSRRFGIGIGFLLGTDITPEEVSLAGSESTLRQQTKIGMDGFVFTTGRHRDRFERVSWEPDDAESDDWLKDILGEV